MTQGEPLPYSAEEIADLIRGFDSLDFADPAGKPERARLAATLAELEGLRQDKERLDVLEEHAATSRQRGSKLIRLYDEHGSLRAAIDAHLAASQAPGRER